MTIKDRESVTRCIKGALALRGLTISDLADLLDIDRTSISRTINRSALTISDLLRIASAIGADLCISFEGGEETNRKPGSTNKRLPTE
jgi:transcriptional regulator with XRE-family HTH domain